MTKANSLKKPPDTVGVGMLRSSGAAYLLAPTSTNLQYGILWPYGTLTILNHYNSRGASTSNSLHMRCRNMFAIRHGEKLMKQIAKQDEKLSDLKGLTLSSASTPSLMDITRNLQVLQTRCGNSKYSQFCKCSLTRMIKGIITSFTQFSRKSNKNVRTMNF